MWFFQCRKNSESGVLTQRLQKADELVDLARFTAQMFVKPMCCKFPQLRNASRFEEWEFFATVLGVWSAFVRIQFDLPRAMVDDVETRVLKNLKAWHPRAVTAFNDLQLFVLNLIAKESDRSKRRELTELSGGTWLVWNVTNKQVIADEGILTGALGNLFVGEFSVYWRINTS